MKHYVTTKDLHDITWTSQAGYLIAVDAFAARTVRVTSIGFTREIVAFISRASWAFIISLEPWTSWALSVSFESWATGAFTVSFESWASRAFTVSFESRASRAFIVSIKSWAAGTIVTSVERATGWSVIPSEWVGTRSIAATAKFLARFLRKSHLG